MLIYVFPPHYQLVYINLNISSFSVISYSRKEHLLPCERASFTVLKLTCYFQCMNLYYTPSYALFPFITSEYLALYIIITTP